MAEKDDTAAVQGDRLDPGDHDNWYLPVDDSAIAERVCPTCGAAQGERCHVGAQVHDMMHAKRSPGWTETARRWEDLSARRRPSLDEDDRMRLWNCLLRGDTLEEALSGYLSGEADPVAARNLWDGLINGYTAYMKRPYPGTRSEWSDEYRDRYDERRLEERAIAAGAWARYLRENQTEPDE